MAIATTFEITKLRLSQKETFFAIVGVMRLAKATIAAASKWIALLSRADSFYVGGLLRPVNGKHRRLRFRNRVNSQPPKRGVPPCSTRSPRALPRPRRPYASCSGARAVEHAAHEHGPHMPRIIVSMTMGTTIAAEPASDFRASPSHECVAPVTPALAGLFCFVVNIEQQGSNKLYYSVLARDHSGHRVASTRLIFPIIGIVARPAGSAAPAGLFFNLESSRPPDVPASMRAFKVVKCGKGGSGSH